MTSCNLDLIGGEWQIQIPCSKKNHPWAKRIMQDALNSVEAGHAMIFENSASIEAYINCGTCARHMAKKIREAQ